MQRPATGFFALALVGLFSASSEGSLIRLARVEGLNLGPPASDVACSFIPGCVLTAIDTNTYNSMTVAQLRAQVDVLLLDAASPDRNDDWATRIAPFLGSGGGIVWDGDLPGPTGTSPNIDDLQPFVHGSLVPYLETINTSIVPVPGLTDGITTEFLHSHVIFSQWDSCLSAFLFESVFPIGLAGNCHGGRIVLTGMDNDWHGVRGGAGASGNQYNLLKNEIAWVAPSMTAAAPEPSALFLLGAGLVGLVGYARRKYD